MLLHTFVSGNEFIVFFLHSLLAHLRAGSWRVPACSLAIFLLYGVGRLTFPFVRLPYCDSEVCESVILMGQPHISLCAFRRDSCEFLHPNPGLKGLDTLQLISPYCFNLLTDH